MAKKPTTIFVHSCIYHPVVAVHTGNDALMAKCEKNMTGISPHAHRGPVGTTEPRVPKTAPIKPYNGGWPLSRSGCEPGTIHAEPNHPATYKALRGGYHLRPWATTPTNPKLPTVQEPPHSPREEQP